jgi:peptide-methionine (S)-S-oxide reductase
MALMDGEEIATLGGGCFWCLQPIFEEIKGVTKVEVGYSGGTVPNPSYEQVCTGKTGHAEVVQITFDPKVLSFEELLAVFFSVHDPTTPNRQGPDVGPQYRSAIFYHTPEQKTAAERAIAELNKAGTRTRSVVTEVAPFDGFYRAEDYHQDYFRRNPRQAYCRVVIAPKIAKFRKRLPAKLKA